MMQKVYCHLYGTQRHGMYKLLALILVIGSKCF